MRRSTRGLHHKKGTKIVSDSSLPLSSEGDDGDQRMINGVLYIKDQGRWFPFKSGSGNINDGWHGSQRYVKILPTDFLCDNESVGSTAPALTYSDSLGASNSYAANQGFNAVTPTDGSLGLYRSLSGADSIKGIGAFISIPLGYWAIACKIYTNTAIANKVMVYEADLTDGSADTLLVIQGSTNERIVFDTAMLGQERNYLHVTINNLPSLGMTYGGYVELRRVQTAEAITEEESDTGGQVLAR